MIETVLRVDKQNVRTRSYSTVRRNESPVPVITWANLENTTLSEMSQTQKDKYCMIPVPGIVKFVETESRIEVPGVWGEERMGS